MAKVIDDGDVTVYIYDEYKRPGAMPHCEVRWDGGMALVSLPSLRAVVGVLLEKARLLLLDNHDALCRQWDVLNVEG